jgi:DNA gyrase subunit B
MTPDLKVLESLLDKRKSGTSVTFLPDIQVFKGEDGKPDITFDTSRLRGRMDEIAYLHAGLVLTLKDERSTSPAKSHLQRLTPSQHYQVIHCG